MNLNHTQQTALVGSPSSITDILWQSYARNLNSGASDVIELPIHLKTFIGPAGIEVMAHRFRSDSLFPSIIDQD